MARTKYANKKRLPKKRYYRRRKRLNPTVRLTRFPSTGLPSSVLIKHKYFYTNSPTSTTTAWTNLMRLNSLYDPDATGVGAQPYYRDQMAALYASYRVYAVKVTLTMVSESGTIAFGMKAQPDTSTLATANLGFERPLTKTAIIANGQRSFKMTKYFDLPSLFGVSKQAYEDEDFSAAVNTNPARQYYLQIFSQHLDGTTSAVGRLMVQMTYYSKWFDRIRQNES